MASPYMNNMGYPHYPPPPPSSPPHPVSPPPPPPSVHPITPPPPPPHVHPATPPPPQPKPHPQPPPPPPPQPIPPPSPSPDNHPTVIIVIIASIGCLFFLAFALFALWCFVKKRKKRMVQETETLHIDEHKRITEAIVEGRHGPEAVVLSVEDDVHIHEEIKKNEINIEDQNMHTKSADITSEVLESGKSSPSFKSPALSLNSSHKSSPSH